MIVFWTGIAIIIIWILAKKAGLFNTPLIIEAIPYFGGVVTVLAVVKEFGKLIGTLNKCVSDINDIKLELKDVRNYIGLIKQELHSLDKRVAIFETRL